MSFLNYKQKLFIYENYVDEQFFKTSLLDNKNILYWVNFIKETKCINEEYFCLLVFIINEYDFDFWSSRLLKFGEKENSDININLCLKKHIVSESGELILDESEIFKVIIENKELKIYEFDLNRNDPEVISKNITIEKIRKQINKRIKNE